MTGQLRVGFLLTPNFTLTAFSTFVDVLRLAADKGDRSEPIDCAWEVMSPARRAVRSSCGVRIEPSSDMQAPESFDYIVIVGGLLRSMPRLAPEIAEYLQRAAKAKVPLVGVCTGSFVLCRLGLMKGRKCCVSWYHYHDFIEEFPKLVPVADRLFVVDGDRITCSGGIGVADLAAQLVAGRLGLSVAQKALHILLVDHPRSERSAQPVPPLESVSDDTRISRALLLMEQNLARRMPIEDVADEIGIGRRQLARLFMEHLGQTPSQVYLTLRLRHGEWMLRNSGASLAVIATQLGFADASHFGRSFKKLYGSSPARTRRIARRNLVAAKKRRSREIEEEARRIFV